ncbi:uncharacterized protein LOC121517021 [Cheilinus undulatus]|uniref:uncharacterized protein LOC121517021 n=1 Tax=Cheilinus undulatus TaxID=241271 RepID=UPI001BD43455|nr:uncharacterized protein LOC121517021 [Cheilinus undulatus]
MAAESRACCEATWAQEDISGRDEGKLHVTVRKQSEGRFHLEMCKGCKLYHCPFCQPAVWKPREYALAWTHVEIHRMRALKHGEFNIHVCQLKCRGERHYHCPYCNKTIINRKHFEHHMNKCLQMQNSAKAKASPSTPTQPAPAAGPCAILLVNLAPPLQHTVMMGQTPAPSKPLFVPISASDQPAAPQDHPAECKPTPGQLSALPEPPLQSNPSSDQPSATTEPSMQPSSSSDKPSAPSQPPITSKSTSNKSFTEQDSTLGKVPSPSGQNIDLTPTAFQQAAYAQATTPQVHPSSLMGSPRKQTGRIYGTVGKKVKCPLCNLYLNRNNLRIHNLRKHLISERDITVKDNLRSQCIDSNKGVYAVAKSYKATAVPLHVIKKKSGSTSTMMCEDDRCKSISDFRKRSKLPENQCPHLRSVDFCLTRAKRVDLKPEVLEELVVKRMIGKDMVDKCLNHQDLASQSRTPLITLVDLGGYYCLYLSVFEPRMTPYSKSGRVFVTFTLKGRLWHCVCSRGRVPCLHRCIAKWFLLQTKTALLCSSYPNQDTSLNISELMEDSPADSYTETAPGNEDTLKQMAGYIYNQKKLPSLFPEEINRVEPEIQFPKNLVPAETVCQVCMGHVFLAEPVLITNKAKVVTLTGMTEDSSTFFRKCPDCQMVYRYQEWSEGLHNYNDHVILSLQLCMLLQNSIKIHGADGGMEVLQQTASANTLCDMEVLQAYLHFEALTSHTCQSEVMMELHQKGVFSMAGLDIKGLPGSCTGEVNAEDFWDTACLEIITSSLEGSSLSYAASSDGILKSAALSAVTSFTPTDRNKLTKQRAEECHRAVAKFLVKGQHPVSTVETPWFREMTEMLNRRYRPPSKDYLINKVITSWFAAEKKSVIKELLQVSKAALTCDLWTSIYHDQYRTVSVHFIIKGQLMQKVLRTKQVYDTQADTAVAEQISTVLKEFGVERNVVAMTADNAFSIDRDIKKLKFRKLRCFAQILSTAAQKVYTSNTVARWASKIRAAVVWMKSSSTAETVLLEKQKLLNMPQHSLVVDVQGRWNSLYLMVERFVEQYAAIQATTADPRIKQSVEKRRLETVSNDDDWKAVEFIRTMKPLYTSALCVSAEKSPSCSQIFPILKKLEAHFEPRDEDSLFTATLKEKVWSDLSTCYKDGDTWKFLQESSALDPRFKNSVDSDEIWHRVNMAAVRAANLKEVSNSAECRHSQEDSDDEYSNETLPPKRPKLSALEELFEEEDRALKSCTAAETTLSIPERVQQEIQQYRKLPAIPTSQDALVWWWERRTTLALLSELSNSYLCVQASSTPRERVFSTAGDTVSRERLHIVPERVDMQIFLLKNT